jgi:hypothetical protein
LENINGRYWPMRPRLGSADVPELLAAGHWVLGLARADSSAAAFAPAERPNFPCHKPIVLSDTIAKLRTTSDQSCVILIVDSTDIVGADPFGTGSA